MILMIIFITLGQAFSQCPWPASLQAEIVCIYIYIYREREIDR